MKRWIVALVGWLLLLAPQAHAQTQSTYADRFILRGGPCAEINGTGDPNGSKVGSPCDRYVRTDTSATAPTVYVKLTGAATNTGWVPVLAASPVQYGIGYGASASAIAFTSSQTRAMLVTSSTGVPGLGAKNFWMGTFHAYDYGAIPDDGNDDSTALQAALDAAMAAGGVDCPGNGAPDAGRGQIVYLPPGAYKLSSPLKLRGCNVTLRGAGRAVTRLQYAGTDAAVKLGGDIGDVVTLGVNHASQNYYTTLEDFSIELTSTQATGIRLLASYYPIIQRVYIECWPSPAEHCPLYSVDCSQSTSIGILIDGSVDHSTGGSIWQTKVNGFFAVGIKMMGSGSYPPTRFTFLDDVVIGQYIDTENPVQSPRVPVMAEFGTAYHFEGNGGQHAVLGGDIEHWNIGVRLLGSTNTNRFMVTSESTTTGYSIEGEAFGNQFLTADSANTIPWTETTLPTTPGRATTMFLNPLKSTISGGMSTGAANHKWTIASRITASDSLLPGVDIATTTASMLNLVGGRDTVGTAGGVTVSFYAADPGDWYSALRIQNVASSNGTATLHLMENGGTVSAGGALTAAGTITASTGDVAVTTGNVSVSAGDVVLGSANPSIRTSSASNIVLTINNTHASGTVLNVKMDGGLAICGGTTEASCSPETAGIRIMSSAPGTTTSVLWNDSGTLKWGTSALAVGSFVATSRTINGYDLTTDRSLTYTDVGASASSHTHTTISNSLDINGASSDLRVGRYLYFDSGSDYSYYYMIPSGPSLYFGSQSGGNVATINGSSGAYAAISKRSAKRDIEPLLDALSIIDALKPRTYRFRADASATLHAGFIADEVQHVFPPAYVEQAAPGGETWTGVTYQELVPVLVRALQQLADRVRALEHQ
jgi:hypothetical protein